MVKRLKRPKTELVFNAAEREDFLTGFQKRKQARKKKAILEAEKQYKEEIIRMRKTKRAQIEKRIEEVSSVKLAHGIELTNFAQFDEPKNTTLLDLPEHTITITSTEEMDLTKSSDAAYLGRNEDEEEAVEVVELTGTDKGDDEEKYPRESKPIRVNKNAQRELANRITKLEKKTQLLKKKNHHRKVLESGKTPKSKKKYLKKKLKNKTKTTSSH